MAKLKGHEGYTLYTYRTQNCQNAKITNPSLSLILRDVNIKGFTIYQIPRAES